MKQLEQIQATLRAFEAKYGVPIADAQQGSEPWFTAKLGVLSASNASKIVAGKTTEGRATYMASLVAQVATGIFEEINAKELDWGNTHEPAALASYELITGRKVERVPFVFADETYRAGCSPDGLILIDDGAVQAKCPYNSANFIKFVCDSSLKSEWVWQNQMEIYLLNCSVYDNVQYDPRMLTMNTHIIRTPRDEVKQKTLADAIPQFIHDMDQMLAKLDIKFGDQWARRNSPS